MKCKYKIKNIDCVNCAKKIEDRPDPALLPRGLRPGGFPLRHAAAGDGHRVREDAGPAHRRRGGGRAAVHHRPADDRQPHRRGGDPAGRGRRGGDLCHQEVSADQGRHGMS